MLKGSNDDDTRLWWPPWRAENSWVTCLEDRRIPTLARYLDMLICDCATDTQADATFTSLRADANLLQDPSVSRHNGTADEPQTPDQRRQACLALLALVKARSDPLFQPSPLTSKQLLDNFAREDPINPSVQLSTPRAVADSYMELYHNAQHMRDMLRPACVYAL